VEKIRQTKIRVKVTQGSSDRLVNVQFKRQEVMFTVIIEIVQLHRRSGGLWCRH